jgi:hypothetical protein
MVTVRTWLMVSLVRVTQNVEEVSLQNDPTLMMADPDPDPAGWLDTAVLPVVVVDGVEAEFLEKSTLNEPVWLCTANDEAGLSGFAGPVEEEA